MSALRSYNELYYHGMIIMPNIRPKTTMSSPSSRLQHSVSVLVQHNNDISIITTPTERRQQQKYDISIITTPTQRRQLHPHDTNTKTTPTERRHLHHRDTSYINNHNHIAWTSTLLTVLRRQYVCVALNCCYSANSCCADTMSLVWASSLVAASSCSYAQCRCIWHVSAS